MGNYLLKRNIRDFLKIAIETRKKNLCGSCLLFKSGSRSKLNRADRR